MTTKITTNSGSFQVASQDNNLLETLERTGHQVEYQCRQGYCGACRTTLVAGSVTYHTEPLAAVTENAILPCCCRANDNVTLAVTIHELV